MTTLTELLRRALAEKRAADIKRQLAKEEPTPDEPTCRMKRVRCRTCLGGMDYDEYITLHNGRPVFCICPPEQEDLVVFWVDVMEPLDPEL